MHSETYKSLHDYTPDFKGLDSDDDDDSRHGFKNWVYKKLHSWDIYAKPITLTFNKKPAFATVPGGLCSMFTYMLFFPYLMI